MKTVKHIFYYLLLPVLAITVFTMGKNKWVAIFPIAAVALQAIVEIYLKPAS